MTAVNLVSFLFFFFFNCISCCSLVKVAENEISVNLSAHTHIHTSIIHFLKAEEGGGWQGRGRDEWEWWEEEQKALREAEVTSAPYRLFKHLSKASYTWLGWMFKADNWIASGSRYMNTCPRKHFLSHWEMNRDSWLYSAKECSVCGTQFCRWSVWHWSSPSAFCRLHQVLVVQCKWLCDSLA